MNEILLNDSIPPTFKESCQNIFSGSGFLCIYDKNEMEITEEFCEKYFQYYQDGDYTTLWEAFLQEVSVYVYEKQNGIALLDASQDGSSYSDGMWCYATTTGNCTGSMSSVLAGQFEGGYTMTGEYCVVDKKIVDAKGPSLDVAFSYPGDWFEVTPYSFTPSATYTTKQATFKGSFTVKMTYKPYGDAVTSEILGPYKDTFYGSI
jgi:hypothetical protein